MTKLQGADAINKEIAGIRAAGAKFDKRVQACALACLEHMEQHGDYTLLVNLYQALPKGSRRTAWPHGSCAIANSQRTPTRPPERQALPAGQGKGERSGRCCRRDVARCRQARANPDEILDVQKAVLALLAKVKKAKRQARRSRGLDDETLAALATLKA